MKFLGLQRWMEEEWLNLRRLWPQYGLIVWRRCNRFESFIPSFFFIAKENHDYLKHVLLVVLCEDKAPSNSAGDLCSEPPNAKVGVAVVVVVVIVVVVCCSLAPFELFTGPLWPLLRATQCQGGCCCCCCFLWFYPSLWIVHCPLWPLFRATQCQCGWFVFCKIC